MCGRVLRQWARTHVAVRVWHARCVRELLFGVVGAMGVSLALVCSIPMSTREQHLKIRMKK